MAIEMVSEPHWLEEISWLCQAFLTVLGFRSCQICISPNTANKMKTLSSNFKSPMQRC